MKSGLKKYHQKDHRPQLRAREHGLAYFGSSWVAFDCLARIRYRVEELQYCVRNDQVVSHGIEALADVPVK